MTVKSGGIPPDAKRHGKPKTCPDCRAVHPWIMVQYGRFSGTRKELSEHPCHMDGYSELQCGSCGARFGAFSGKRLAGTFEDGEHEAPYGDEHHQGCQFALREPVKLRLIAAS